MEVIRDYNNFNVRLGGVFIPILTASYRRCSDERLPLNISGPSWVTAGSRGCRSDDTGFCEVIKQHLSHCTPNKRRNRFACRVMPGISFGRPENELTNCAPRLSIFQSAVHYSVVTLGCMNKILGEQLVTRRGIKMDMWAPEMFGR